MPRPDGPEGALLAATPSPRTREGLGADLRRLGFGAGDAVLVHCSLRAIGWVSGGAVEVIQALLDVLSEAGTLVMPAQSSYLTDPAEWSALADPIAVPAAWHDAIRASLPAYDPRTTPTRGMGAVAEQFRTWPGAVRGLHPTRSFAAAGPAAAWVLDPQPLEDPFGEDSPLGRLHAMRAKVLLLGVGFDRCTALHLAERRAWPSRSRVLRASPMLVRGERRWVRYAVPPQDSGLFPEIGRRLAAAGVGAAGPVGSAACRLFPVREAVDAATALWRSGTAVSGRLL